MPEQNKTQGGTTTRSEVTDYIQRIQNSSEYLNVFESFVQHGRKIGMTEQQLLDAVNQGWSGGGSTGTNR